MILSLLIALYLAGGAAWELRLGRPTSRLRWAEPPSLFQRLVVMVAWVPIAGLAALDRKLRGALPPRVELVIRDRETGEEVHFV